MPSPLCRLPGIDFPLFALSHCGDVVLEATKAGGFGVPGAVGQDIGRMTDTPSSRAAVQAVSDALGRMQRVFA